jgi:chloramphenicol 3-O-phosphotransferase
LERRERERKDRKKGNARNQYFKLHVGKSYDIEVNTYEISYNECTDRIVSYVRNNKPFAFYTNRVDE